MHKEYGDLSDTRTDFWQTMDAIYSVQRLTWAKPHVSPEKLHELVVNADPPCIEGNVAEWVEKNLKDPESKYFHNKPFHKQLWKLASFVYPEKGDIFHGEDRLKFSDDPRSPVIQIPNTERFHAIRAELAWFWDKWTPLLKTRYITERYDSAKPEVYLLLWLELALALKIGQPGRGKIELRKLAGKFQSKR